MRIVLLGHEDIASLYALDQVVGALPEHDYTVFWSGRLRVAASMCHELEELAEKDHAMFRRLLEAPATAAVFSVARPLAEPNAPDGLQALRAASPDLVVSIRYRRILRDKAIGIPRQGVLNLHSGILPDYRGVMATFWAMQNQEAEIGSTLHRIVDSGIDTGPLIHIERRPADYSQSYLWNVLALYKDGAAAVARAIAALDRGEAVAGDVQPAGRGRYFSAPGPDDIRAFLAAGRTLADAADFALMARGPQRPFQSIDNV